MRGFVLVVSLALLGVVGCRNDCHPKHNDFEDADEDGICDAEDICEGGDDALDEDGDGVPDGCDEEYIVGFTLSDKNVGAPTEAVKVWMAYDAIGSLNTWRAIDPGWTFASDELGQPVSFETTQIPGWSSFSDRLKDDSNQEMALVIEATDQDGVRFVERFDESEVRLDDPALQDATITRIEVSLTGWRTDVNSVIGVSVGFYGR